MTERARGRVIVILACGRWMCFPEPYRIVVNTQDYHSVTQAKAYYHTAIQFNPKDESAYLNSAITKVTFLLTEQSRATLSFSKSPLLIQIIHLAATCILNIDSLRLFSLLRQRD